jgi:hypothetical protein
MSEVFGPVASDTTVWRMLDELDRVRLRRVATARAKVRARLWQLVRVPPHAGDLRQHRRTTGREVAAGNAGEHRRGSPPGADRRGRAAARFASRGFVIEPFVAGSPVLSGVAARHRPGTAHSLDIDAAQTKAWTNAGIDRECGRRIPCSRSRMAGWPPC